MLMVGMVLESRSKYIERSSQNIHLQVTGMLGSVGSVGSVGITNPRIQTKTTYWIKSIHSGLPSRCNIRSIMIATAKRG